MLRVWVFGFRGVFAVSGLGFKVSGLLGFRVAVEIAKQLKSMVKAKTQISDPRRLRHASNRPRLRENNVESEASIQALQHCRPGHGPMVSALDALNTKP